MAEMCTHLATERARRVTLRLQLARPSSIPTTSGICERLGVKLPGATRHKYVYRAVDSSGQTINFLLTAKRDEAALKHFFRKA
jgi:hypothetical protein